MGSVEFLQPLLVLFDFLALWKYTLPLLRG